MPQVYQHNRFLASVRAYPRLSFTLLIFILFASGIWVFHEGSRWTLEGMSGNFDRRREDYKHFLELLIEKPLLVPEVLATSSNIHRLLLKPDATIVDSENKILEETAHKTQIDVIYIMDVTGKTISSSNWQESDSFVGHNYKFRPYFKQAMADHVGHYIAKGVTSQKVGQYLSCPVKSNGKVIGAVVVKVNFESLQRRAEKLWLQDQEMMFITDEKGVIFISPIRELRFKTILPITGKVRRSIERSRQYGVKVIPIVMSVRKSNVDGLYFVSFKDIPNSSFVQKAYDLTNIELRLYLQVPASRYWQSVATFTVIYVLLAVVVLLISVGIFLRWSYREKLLDAAIRDPLTDLHTRLYMRDWCDVVIRAHERNHDDGFGLMIFDLDRFKAINDAHGHLFGDKVLKQVGQIIRGSIRPDDLAVRFGGEELAVFVHGLTEAETVSIAERIQRKVSECEFKDKSDRVVVTLSGGVAFHIVGETLEALFARADKKLYEAKTLGRNRVCV